MTKSEAAVQAFAPEPVEVVKGSGAMLGDSPLALLSRAVERGTPVEAIEKLVQLVREEQDRAAAREFAEALARFQSTCPPIPKTSTASIVSEAKGTKFSYSYAELDTIARTVAPHLHPLGFSYSWDSEVGEATVTAIATLRHRNGHSISARFSAPVDSAARMNVSQRHAAALTYAKRQALVQVLGITTADPDDDTERPSERITADQAATLQALIDETGANVAKVLTYAGVTALDDVRKETYPAIIRGLEARRKAGQK